MLEPYIDDSKPKDLRLKIKNPDSSAAGYNVVAPDGSHHLTSKQNMTDDGVRLGNPAQPFTVGVEALHGVRESVTYPAPPPPPALTVTQNLTDGQELSEPLTWSASPSGSVSRVEFFIDGVLKWTENYAPYIFNGDGQLLDPSKLTDGTHAMKVVATGGLGTASVEAEITVDAPPPPPPPPTGQIAGRVGTFPDMSGGWLDKSATTASDHDEWNDLLDRVLEYGYGNVPSWHPGAHRYIDTYANYRAGGPGTPPSHLPETVLKTADGKYVYIDWRESDGSYRQYAADPANQAWRDDFLNRCKDALARGCKGIFWDDFNLTFRFNDGAGNQVVPIDPRTGQLITVDNWCKYMVEMAEYVTGKLPPVEHSFNTIWFAAGGLHDGMDKWMQRLCRIPGTIISYERGFNDANIHGNLDLADGWSFGSYMRHMDNVHAAGAKVWTHSYASTEAQALFNLAATLLISNGTDFQGGRFGMVPTAWWQPHSTNLGAAKGPRYAIGTNKLRRDFDKGFVEVDFAARTGRIVLT